MPDKVTIVPYGISLGFVLSSFGEDKMILTKQELEDKICILLSGRASEEFIFGEISTGAQNDILKANELAYSMVCDYGMSKYKNKIFTSNKSNILNEEIEFEINKILDKSYKKALNLLNENNNVLNLIAKTLYKKEDLNSHDLEKIFHTALI